MWGTSIAGCTLWGGVPPTTPEEVLPPVGLDVQLEIQGQDLTEYLGDGSITIKDESGERNSCSFTLQDEASELRILPGQRIVVRSGGTVKKFAGLVSRVSSRCHEDSSKSTYHKVEAIDWNQLADRHIVAVHFDAGLTLGAVIRAILSTYSGDTNERLADDGVTWFSGNAEGPVLGALNFDYCTVTDALDDLGDLSGYTWKIDYDLYLRVFDRTEYVAPVTLDDEFWEQYRDLEVTWDLEQYRNQQDLRGGEVPTTETRTEKFRGDGGVDGGTKTFTLSMKVAESMKPVLLIGATPVNPATIDIRRNDQKQETIEWFYEVGGRQISQNSGEGFTALTSSQVLTVQFRGVVPVHVRARAEDEIAAMAEREGTTGVWHEVETDEDIDSEDMAMERAQGLLRRYGRTRCVVKFGSMTDGFASGQMLAVNRPSLGLSGEFMIRSVTCQSISMVAWNYEVEAALGEGERGWSDFWRRMTDKGRPMVLRENTSLVILRKLSSGVILGGAQSTSEVLADETLDYRSVAIFHPSCPLARQLENGGVSGPVMGLAYRAA